MNVKSILSDKGREVVTIAPTATLAEAIRLLAERHIGAAVVTENGDQVAGILSERDIVRAAAGNGGALFAIKVSEIMTRDVVTCAEGDTIAAIMELMTSGKFRHLPVLHDGRLAGIVSIRDVVEHRLQQMERESEQLRDYIRSA
jgi:CBS domain-containing protein